MFEKKWRQWGTFAAAAEADQMALHQENVVLAEEGDRRWSVTQVDNEDMKKELKVRTLSETVSLTRSGYQSRPPRQG
jgi:hypothetical protein